MIARRLSLTVVAFVTLAAGCTVLGPDYERPQSTLPGTFFEGGATGPAIVLAPDWWKLYNDATLNELVAAALARNADVRIAAARIEETDANLREAGAAFLPQVDLAATGTRS